MILLIYAILFLIGGFAIIIFSSLKAVKHSAILAAALGISPLIIGVTLVSVGTDIAEIFNSIISCSLGHGDIDVGDSVGSDLTQLTLVFGLLPLITGVIYVHRRDIIILGACEILSLIVIFSGVEKGYITRLNAILMVSSLGIYIWIIYNANKGSILQRAEMIEKMEAPKSKKYHLLIAVLASYMIVNSVIILSSLLNIHEYIISFFIVALGTSLPELAVDINALRMGHHSIAIGDIVGSCIVDSTLSIGIGQVLFPQDWPGGVTASLAVPTVLYTLVASLIVFILVAARRKIDKKAGILFILLYFTSYVFLFSFWL